MKKIDQIHRPQVHRPWGGYAILKKTATFWVKKLYVHPKARLSLQSHQFRDEVWFVLSGTIIAQIGAKKKRLKAGDCVCVPKRTKHRITGAEAAVILEVAFGRVLETDIVRYEDDYGRV